MITSGSWRVKACLLYIEFLPQHFFAASLEVLDKVEVEYITFPGWKTSIQNCKTFDDLPANAQAYVRKIEELTQIPSKSKKVINFNKNVVYPRGFL